MSYARLKARQKAEKSTQSASVTLRLHRAISWLGKAENERSDADARFIFLWISFNAAYASEALEPDMTEKRGFQKFPRTLIKLDRDNRNSHLARKQFSKTIRVVLVNKHVFFHC
jgi:hypothetical protein